MGFPRWLRDLASITILINVCYFQDFILSGFLFYVNSNFDCCSCLVVSTLTCGMGRKQTIAGWKLLRYRPLGREVGHSDSHFAVEQAVLPAQPSTFSTLRQMLACWKINYHFTGFSHDFRFCWEQSYLVRGAVLSQLRVLLLSIRCRRQHAKINFHFTGFSHDSRFCWSWEQSYILWGGGSLTAKRLLFISNSTR